MAAPRTWPRFQLKHMNKNEESMNQNYLELTELRYVLEKAEQVFAQSDPSSLLPTQQMPSESAPLLGAAGVASAFAAPEDDPEAGVTSSLGYVRRTGKHITPPDRRRPFL